MIKTSVIGSVTLLALSISFYAGAAAPKAHHAKASQTAYEPPAPDSSYPYMTDDQYASLKKKYKEEASRQVAQVDFLDDEKILSNDLKNLRNEIIGGPAYDKNGKTGQKYLGISTADGVAALIQKVKANYSELAQDAQFVAVALIAMEPYRGITVRMRPLFNESSGINSLAKVGFQKRAPVTHASVVTALRLVGAGIDVYAPTEQWKAGFAYFTEPYEGIGKDIGDDNDLKRFVATEVLPAVTRYMKQVSAMNLSKNIYFDNKIMLANADFVAQSSPGDRFIRIGEAERLSILSGAQLYASAVHGSIAYSWNGMIDSWDAVASIYGFQNAFKVEGATAEERTKKLRAFQGRLLIYSKSNGAGWMTESEKFLREGVRTAKLSYLAVKEYSKDSEGQKMAFDPRAFAPFNRVITTGFGNIEGLLDGKGVHSAVVSGAVVDCNVSKFFTDPPQDMMAFLPREFVKGAHERKLAGRTYRDYMVGSPKGWDTSAYRKYCTNVNTDKDVQAAARILSQAWGGWVIGLPFAAMVL